MSSSNYALSGARCSPMTTLYIIGNGFDLWHGLPTGYDNFYEYARESLDELEAYYIVDATTDRPWHDFENCLGKYDYSSFYDAYNEIDVASDSFRRRDVYCLEDELNEHAGNLVESIEDLFHEWVSEVDILAAQKKINFDQGALYLTFNYTSTLQLVYGVNDSAVRHIHGKSERMDKLIFGHGESREEEPEIDESGDSNRTMFTDAEGAAKYPFYAFKKPVSEIIENNQEYFRSLRGITRIVVIGHSLNDIDFSYFQEIVRNTVDCNWLIYCYKESGVDHHKSQLLRCGVSASCITTCGYEAP